MTNFVALRSTRQWLGAALLCLMATLVQAQTQTPSTIRYVKPAATGTGDGSSWANASGNLQRVIDRSAPDDQVWVATGLYKPTRIPPGLDPTDDRKKTFFFSNGVTLIGGFDGDETAPNQRDLTGPSSTTLSGDLGKPNSITVNKSGFNEFIGYFDNANTVVTIRGSSKTQVDNVIITGGDGVVGAGILNDGSATFNSGSVGSRPTIRNCHIVDNSASSGGGIAEIGGTQSSGATYINCIIAQNRSSSRGGGLYCAAFGSSCSPTFANCSFIANKSTEGGGVCLNAADGVCSPTFTNTIFRGNIATNGCQSARGGALSLGVGVTLGTQKKNAIMNVKLTSCFLFENAGQSEIDCSGGAILPHYGGAIYSQDVTGGITLTNCTITRNRASRGSFMYAETTISPKPAFAVVAKNCIIQTDLRNQYISPYNAAVTYSLVEKDDSFLAGKGNITDGAFSVRSLGDTYGGDGYQLYSSSSAINAGDPSTNPKDLPATDLDGNPRFQGRIDIGAYERDVLPNRPPVALTHPDETAAISRAYHSGGQEAFFVDPEDKPLTLTATGLPASLSLVRNATGSYALSGTPTATGVSSVTLTAKDPDGLLASLTFQLVVEAAPVVFQLTAPTYDCQTGAFTFNTTGGDGSTIEYFAPGITAWTGNPNQFVDQALRTANDVNPFTLMARQRGVVVTYGWNLKAACGRARMAASETTDGLSVRVLGNPIVGETAQVEISGTNGQPLTLQLTDTQGRLVSTDQIDQPAATETRTLRLGQSAGVYLLRASSQNQHWTVRLVRP